MMKRTLLMSAIALLGIWQSPDAGGQTTSATSRGAESVAVAANKFLATLDDAKRAKVQSEFKDEAQRRRWSNLPSGIFQRAGLRMGDLTQAQRDAVMGMLAAALSPQGYEKVRQIVEADEVLKQGDGGRPGGPPGPGGPGGPPDSAGPGGRGGRGPGGPGGGLTFGKDNYYVSLLGQPSEREPWMIQFGGHHLGLNITLAGAQRTLAPSHTGAQPAIYQIEGRTVRPLGREVEKAFNLLNSLDEPQRKQAILGSQFHDLVLGPGREGRTIQPEGIKGHDLTEKQREMLLDLAGEWTGILSETAGKAKLEELRKDLADTWFAWSGSTEKGGAAYFRIQGPTVIIEYAPQRMGNEATKHIHTIYRDPTNEYGAKWCKS